MSRALEPLLRHFKILYFTAALAQIHPLHPDVPDIVRELNRLRSLG